MATTETRHHLLDAVRPLVDRLGAELVGPDAAGARDVPLSWDGEVVAAVRLPADGPGDLAGLIDEVSGELGGSLTTLPRPQKQQAVRLLEERGAFAYRKSAETIAEALGVSRFTVYNYLNRDR